MTQTHSEFEKPVLMFSGGKDSIVMLRLAEKAFFPAKVPFPLLQVDTGLDFDEVLETRDSWVNRLGVKLVVASVEDAIKAGHVIDDGKTSRNRQQIGALLNAIEENGYTAAFGGGRRDEEKARAKERVYSHRGPSSTSGTTSTASRSRSPRSTSPTSVRSSSGTACCSRSATRSSRRATSRR